MIYIGGQKVLTNLRLHSSWSTLGCKPASLLVRLVVWHRTRHGSKKIKYHHYSYLIQGSSNESHGSNTDWITNNYIIFYLIRRISADQLVGLRKRKFFFLLKGKTPLYLTHKWSLIVDVHDWKGRKGEMNSWLTALLKWLTDSRSEELGNLDTLYAL